MVTTASCRKVDLLCLGCTTSGTRARGPGLPGAEPYLDHLMFTLSPATAHSSLAVSPSGTITVEGSPVIVSSPGPKEGALSATTPILPHLTSEAASHAHPPARDCRLTQNSELDPALVSVLPIDCNTGIEASIFHSHAADDQGAVGLQLVSGGQAQLGVPTPRRPAGGRRGRIFPPLVRG